MATKYARVNARVAKQVDAHAARELELFVDNDSGFHRRVKAAEESLARVICRKHHYSVDLAARVFAPILSDAAKQYSREYSVGNDGLRMFDATTRQSLAKEYANDFKQRVNLFLRKGVRDVSPTVQAALTKCAATPLAGRRSRRARRRR